MKDVKYEFNTLCLYDYRAVEEHLSAMAAKGWRLERAGNSVWKYYRSEPKKVRYAVTYSAGASQFNPRPTEEQRSLADLCEEAGWRKVSDWFQMQIFQTEDPDALPLETDEAMRLENIHRSMRKNFLPAGFVLLALGLFMSVSFLGTLFTNPLQIFRRDGSLFTGPLYVFVALLEAYTLFHYYRWRKKSRQSIEDGGPCAPINTRAYQRLNRVGLALLGAYTALHLLLLSFGPNRGQSLFFIVYVPLLLLVIFLVRRSTAFFRHCGASKAGNIAGTLIVDVVLVSILISALTFGAIRFGWFFGSRTGETYQFRDMEWNVEPAQDFPLTISDLTGEEYEHIYRVRFDEGSFFLPERSYRECVVHENGPGRPLPRNLTYTIWEPKFSWLQDALLEDRLDYGYPPEFPYSQRHYEAEDPAPWGADAAYRRYWDDSPSNAWLLVWPDRVAEVGFESAPTEAEKAAAGAGLAPEA